MSHEKCSQVPRLIEIRRCCDCPHCGRTYWHCMKMRRDIVKPSQIENWCPLPVASPQDDWRTDMLKHCAENKNMSGVR